MKKKKEEEEGKEEEDQQEEKKKWILHSSKLSKIKCLASISAGSI